MIELRVKIISHPTIVRARPTRSVNFQIVDWKFWVVIGVLTLKMKSWRQLF